MEKEKLLVVGCQLLDCLLGDEDEMFVVQHSTFDVQH